MQQKSHRFSAYQFLSAALPPCSQVSKSYQMLKSRDESSCDCICYLKAKKLNVYVLREHCNSSLSLGIARGVGWQSIAGYASIGSYYLVGIPVGSILCFVAKLRGRGLWIGILIGCFVQTMVLAHVTFFTNWEQEVCIPFLL